MKRNRSPVYKKLSLLLAVVLLLTALFSGCRMAEQTPTVDLGLPGYSNQTTEDTTGAGDTGEAPLPDDTQQSTTEPPTDPEGTSATDAPTEPEKPAATEAPAEPDGTDTTEAPEQTDAPTDPPATEGNTSHSFQIHFLDVGQADAALVLCGSQAMLIDGGNSADSSLIYSHLKSQGITHLDYVIATHAHEDHVGGLAGALNYATVGTVYCPVTSYSSKAFNNFAKYVEQQGAAITVPKPGLTFSLGSAKVQIIACAPTADANNSSIILRITYGSTSFLFTGDAEREAEQAALNSGYTLKSDVLKVGHHGSNTSTSYVFLREVMPTHAVISVGKGNSYGHPTEEVLSRLRDADAKVYRTDMQGTIIATSNGKTVTMRVTRNPNAETLGPAAPETTDPPETTAPPVTTDSPETTEPPVATDPPTEESAAPSQDTTADASQDTAAQITYVINKRSLLFHEPDCKAVSNMSEGNKQFSYATRDELVSQGYTPCGWCDP